MHRSPVTAPCQRGALERRLPDDADSLDAGIHPGAGQEPASTHHGSVLVIGRTLAKRTPFTSFHQQVTLFGT